MLKDKVLSKENELIELKNRYEDNIEQFKIKSEK